MHALKAVKGETKLGRSGAPEVRQAVRQHSVSASRVQSPGPRGGQLMRPGLSVHGAQRGAPPQFRWKGQRGQYVSSLTSHSCPRIRRSSRFQPVWGSSNGRVQAPPFTHRRRVGREVQATRHYPYGLWRHEIKGSRLRPQRTFYPKVSGGTPAALQGYNETANRRPQLISMIVG